jgi:hypothetical protein
VLGGADGIHLQGYQEQVQLAFKTLRLLTAPLELLILMEMPWTSVALTVRYCDQFSG